MSPASCNQHSNQNHGRPNPNPHGRPNPHGPNPHGRPNPNPHGRPNPHGPNPHPGTPNPGKPNPHPGEPQNGPNPGKNCAAFTPDRHSGAPMAPPAYPALSTIACGSTCATSVSRFGLRTTTYSPMRAAGPLGLAHANRTCPTYTAYLSIVNRPALYTPIWYPLTVNITRMLSGATPGKNRPSQSMATAPASA